MQTLGWKFLFGIRRDRTSDVPTGCGTPTHNSRQTIEWMNRKFRNECVTLNVFQWNTHVWTSLSHLLSHLCNWSETQTKWIIRGEKTKEHIYWLQLAQDNHLHTFIRWDAWKFIERFSHIVCSNRCFREQREKKNKNKTRDRYDDLNVKSSCCEYSHGDLYFCFCEAKEFCAAPQWSQISEMDGDLCFRFYYDRNLPRFCFYLSSSMIIGCCLLVFEWHRKTLNVYVFDVYPRKGNHCQLNNRKLNLFVREECVLSVVDVLLVLAWFGQR